MRNANLAIAVPAIATALAAGLAGCGGGGSSNSPSPPPQQQSEQQAAVQGCRDLANWKGTATNFAFDPISGQILKQAAGTDFASDLSFWISDLTSGDYGVAANDGSNVITDCAAVGVSIKLPQDS
jgi:hypothetical protein